MTRTLTAAAVLLLATLTACGGSTGTTPSKASPASSRAKTGHPAAASTASPAKSCGPSRDVIVWSKTPGIPDSATVVGNYTLATCKTTFDDLPDTSPTQAGYCTLAAWASDNPGYDADARPAKRPKEVQAEVGPAC